MIVFQKLEIFFVLQSILNMKRQGQKIEDIKIHFFVVVTHRIEQGFFIADHIVVY
jgi:hypothetical protein